jgi:hypothetical protein
MVPYQEPRGVNEKMKEYATKENRERTLGVRSHTRIAKTTKTTITPTPYYHPIIKNTPPITLHTNQPHHTHYQPLTTTIMKHYNTTTLHQ